MDAEQADSEVAYSIYLFFHRHCPLLIWHVKRPPPLPKDQGPAICRHLPNRQRLKPKAERLFRDHPGIAHPHSRSAAVQVGIKGRIAGCRGYATAKKGGRRAAVGRRHNVGGVGAEYRLVGLLRSLIGVGPHPVRSDLPAGSRGPGPCGPPG